MHLWWIMQVTVFFLCVCFRTLNNNNLTSLGKDIFEDMFRLRTLRLSDNNLICDCHLAWLARWLRKAPRLGLYTRCFSPNQLKGQNVADLHDQEFKCSGKATFVDTKISGYHKHHNCRFVSTLVFRSVPSIFVSTSAVVRFDIVTVDLYRHRFCRFVFTPLNLYR